MDEDKAETFIAFFTSLFNTNGGPWDCWSPVLEDHDWESYKLPVNFQLVQYLLLQLNGNKSTGPNGIHPRVVKEFTDIITRPNVVIFQWSWETREVPVSWKLAKVIPIFKKGRK